LLTIPHSHDFFEIFWVAGGDVAHVINGERDDLHASVIVFIRPDDVHAYQRLGDVQLINIAFTRAWINQVAAYLGAANALASFERDAMPPMLTLRPSESAALWARHDVLLTLPPDGIERSLRGLCADLFAQLWVRADAGSPPTMPDWLVRLCSYIQQPAAFVEGYTALLREAHCTPAHLSRSFQAYLGMTPTAYLHQVRLRYAANLLAQTDRTIADIAASCGYDNLSLFYRRFLKAHGMTPKTYRSHHRAQALFGD
jgi:AraC family cel operon transcriptional repressor